MSDFDIMEYSTKWYIIAPALIVFYVVYKKINEAYLMKKLERLGKQTPKAMATWDSNFHSG